MPGWALCRAAPHSLKTKSGLYLATEIDKNVQSEGVAVIESVVPREGMPAGVSAGDQVIYRGFLRFANQVGNLMGVDRDCEFFLLNLQDILAVVSGPGTVGVHGEYEVQ
jgi:co-chaperonin GroES (HSP10)